MTLAQRPELGLERFHAEEEHTRAGDQLRSLEPVSQGREGLDDDLRTVPFERDERSGLGEILGRPLHDAERKPLGVEVRDGRRILDDEHGAEGLEQARGRRRRRHLAENAAKRLREALGRFEVDPAPDASRTPRRSWR